LNFTHDGSFFGIAPWLLDETDQYMAMMKIVVQSLLLDY
tara:strand:+ start:463 stop:579 length:117 start_codon:yes stop_codon:yes gene_type:complete